MEKHWPVEIISRILCLLPAKSVIRFKSVSKDWCSLTEESYFFKSHLQQASKTNDDFGLIFVNRKMSIYNLSSVYSADLDSLDNVTERNSPITLNDYYADADVLASCNGLAVVLVTSEVKSDQLLLCNISTQECQLLPISQRKTFVDQWELYGFGYDLINDDYKVLIRDQCRLARTQLYSLRSNEWRKITNNPYATRGQRGVSIGGSINWLAAKTSASFHSLIVAFDLAKEEYRQVPLPEHCVIDHRKRFLGTLGLLGGCLCVTIYYPGFKTCKVDVWVMKDFMVQASWVNMFSILQDGSPIVKPLAYSNNAEDGRVLFLDQYSGKLFWFDYKTGNKVGIDHGLGNLKAKDISLRTLVSLRAYGMNDDGIRKRLLIQDKSQQRRKQLPLRDYK